MDQASTSKTISGVGVKFDDDKTKSITHVNDDEKDDEGTFKTLMFNVLFGPERENLPNIVRIRYNQTAGAKDQNLALKFSSDDTLQILLDAASSRPALVEEVFHIIISACRKHTKAIFLISKNQVFVQLILSHLKSNDDLILLNVLRFLNVVVQRIQNDHNSLWLHHLKSCEFFEHYIIAILKFQLNEELIITATDLLKNIAETNLPEQSNLLEQLFNIHNLIPVLMIPCAQFIILKNSYKIDLQLAYNWLSIMEVIYEDLVIVCHKNERNEGSIFLRIIHIMLYPYQKPSVFLEKTVNKIEQDIDIILKCVHLLLQVHWVLEIPLTLGRNLMNIILNFKTDAEPVQNYLDTTLVLHDLFKYLRDSWITMAKRRRDSFSIAELIIPLGENERKYILDLTKVFLEPKEIEDILTEVSIKELNVSINESETYISTESLELFIRSLTR